MYNWTKEDLKKKIDLYKEAMELETDPYKKAQMACEIDFDINFLFNEFNDIKLRRDSFKKKLFDAYNIHLIASRYIDLAIDFNDAFMQQDVNLFKALYSLNKYEKELEEQNDSFSFSDDTILEYANEFYSEFDKELYEYFLQSYKQRFNHVIFNPQTKKGHYLENGYCFYLYSDKSNYLKLLESTGIEPVYNAIHEYGHAIANSYNPNSILYDNKTNEVSSFFPEFVAFDWNITGATPLLRSSKELELISVLHNYSSSIFFQNQILYIWHKNDYKTDFGFYLECFKEGFKYNAIKETFEGDICDDLTYATSAYIAFYLLSLYRKDPEIAIAKYKHFLTFKDKDEILHEFRTDQVKESVNEEVSYRINGIYDVVKKYGRSK